MTLAHDVFKDKKNLIPHSKFEVRLAILVIKKTFFLHNYGKYKPTVKTYHLNI